MPLELLIDRIAAKLGFHLGSSAEVAGLADSLWSKVVQSPLIDECPSDPVEARGRIRALAAAVVRAEMLGSKMPTSKRDVIEDRVVGRLVERFIAERPIRPGKALPARVAA